MIGRNLSIEDSFTLKFINGTSSDFTFNLFNQGAILGTTPLTNGGVSLTNLADISLALLNSVFIANGNFVVTDTTLAVVINSPYVIGQTLSAFLSTLTTYTDSFGNTGNTFIQATPNDLTGKFYDLIFTTNTIQNFQFNNFPTIFQLARTTTVYVTSNPFLQIQGVVPVTVIQQSETGNAYRIMGIDIISNNKEQLLQDVNYGNKEANGDIWQSSFTPTIDPFQSNSVSIHALGATAIGSPMDDFTINTDTTFSYTVLANSYARLTFNYVKASLSFMREFNMALSTELMMKFATQKKYLDSLKFRKTILLQ